MRALYSSHESALHIVYQEIERYAISQREVFVGTPGSLTKRKNAAGYAFYTRQYYDGADKKREAYLAGPVGDPAADEKAARLKLRIAEAAGIVASVRLLGRNGYALADARTQATLAALHNVRLFDAGAVLVGAHAFGVLLNKLGVRAAQYATEDVDIARGGTLALPKLGRELIAVLEDSGIEFVEVPGLPSTKPPTSYKEKGKSRFHVDLLVPARGGTFPIVPVPEVGAHAQGLPYLDYLLDEAQRAALLAREGVAAVRVPTAERFALHKLLVSQLRRGRDARSDRDLQQAAVLLAVLADKHPGAIEEAAAGLRRSAYRRVRHAFDALRTHLPESCERAWQTLDALPVR
ncbi:MAG TPA: GSU2403 family nucleotidyltransferase fold protein [Casimicrobiaceae bacterium]